MREPSPLGGSAPEGNCRTVGQTERKNTGRQYREGYRDGFAHPRKGCEENAPRQFTAPTVDADRKSGYDDGAADAAKRFRED
ncbi:hypothetical protein JK361_27810 [Streptomyces sp. 5-8]|uniref:Uncharacterized protein n=1 Tax=Streptomyces musisoli TaxID=2802280 RepID=A0ABS1P7L1_9ACTN|nr:MULTISPECIES: hypothetical protein [Streptomyces]MBL1108351.1 hypothetical protein [Streptomyces musisoli]MBY8845519.1 hypothetical protein [Streptomyces sp. SP2-10]